MNLIKYSLYLVFLLIVLQACKNKPVETDKTEERKKDSIEQVRKEEEKERLRARTAADIKIEKDLSYNKHTLEDTYPYEDTTRVFQWEKIKEKLATVENFLNAKGTYAILQNYKNKNREAPVVKNYKRNAYKRVSDTLGVERYQSAPLYVVGETDAPVRYGRDGFLVKLASSDTLDMVKVEGISFEGTYDVPKRYVKNIGDSATFNHVVVVDVTNQNICTLEKTDKGWIVRSMNPATTGRHKPPYAMETPTGMFVIQEKKAKMYYHKDGTTSIEGFAPYASRFTNGAYVHGVPVNNPKGAIIEYSWSLGTIPRSHMCVRNASSHAKFVYDWAKTLNALVIVID
ncbi:L,D-transpeptidase [Sphingobacterium hungaricum]|uniref:L,D-transpeptidase n=1 Tax=Sphingobacterium hungaricum TaxID=2082723 RepID=A0A928YQZ6_9SPHI|nr:L,D-transpeptidase [Sphingobacterium hungaricum]MBE8714464.1 L,D-transpeptidase [Sphingobacterium hungaricum]